MGRDKADFFFLCLLFSFKHTPPFAFENLGYLLFYVRYSHVSIWAFGLDIFIHIYCVFGM